MSYGPFLLSNFEMSLAEDKALGLLDQVARSGYAARFREFVGDRGVEFVEGVHASPDATLHRWLSEEESEELAALKALGNSRPYSHYAYLDGFASVVFPYDHGSGQLTLSLPSGGEETIIMMSAPAAIEGLMGINERLQAKPASFWEGETPLETILGFHNEMIEDIKKCRKAHALYVIGEFC